MIFAYKCGFAHSGMWNAIIQGVLQPLDLLVALKLVVWHEQSSSFEALAKELHISASSAYRSFERAFQAGLVTTDRTPRKAAILEFVIHGVRYVYYVKPGEMTRGMPTAHAAPPLNQLIRQGSDVYVWPDPQGSVRGQAVEPLHQEVPRTAQRDLQLYELLALVDAIRIGRARERSLAEEELRKRLG